MAFENYKNSNNASSKLIADISASATTILITSGDEALFPNEFPFLLTIEKTNSEGFVIVREIVKVTAKSQNALTVVRGAGTCVQDDTAEPRSQGNGAHSFSSGDKISLYRTSEQAKDIQNQILVSANDSSIADEYDTTATYEVGDIVMYLGERYVCNTDITTAEAFDSTKRTKTPVQSDLDTINTVIDQVAPVASNLAGLVMIDLIVVGGGGGGGIAGDCGGSQFGGSGGGGGEVIAGNYLGTSKEYNVVIGCGGTTRIGGCSIDTFPGYLGGCRGGDTKFGPLTAHGGEGGKLDYNRNRSFGGTSGGGYSSVMPVSSFCGGSGGGGAGGMGCTQNSSNAKCGGNGGPGICGFGGGGGGGGHYGTASHGGTATDGGGTGGENGCKGCDATCYGGGGGGGGACHKTGGNGCQGVVIVKYPSDGSGTIKCATGGTITTETIGDVEYTVHTFTSNGVFCILD